VQDWAEDSVILKYDAASQVIELQHSEETAFLWNVGNWIAWWCSIMSQKNSIVRLSTVCHHTCWRWFVVATGIPSSERMTTDTVLVWFYPLYLFWDQCCVSVRVSANVGVLHLGYTCSSYSVPDCVAYCWSSLHITFLCQIYSEIELSDVSHISLYRQVLFYAIDTFLKNIMQIEITQIEHEAPTENIIFPGG